MNLKRRRVFSLVITFAMLFSTVGTAAATEPIELDAQPTVMVETEPEPTFDITEEETEQETGKETEENTEEESKEETEMESEPEEETEEGTESEPEEETEEETESEPGEETEEGTESEPGEETEEETESEPGEETEEGTESEPGEETEEETESEPGEETEEGTESGPGEETEEETESEPEEELKKGDVIENSNEESSHEHCWSEDWNYDGSGHWHECSAEDCPVAENSEKEGYAEHSYDDYGVCTGCGYDAMDGIAVAAEGDIPTYREAYESMIALKEEYPEGMTWTNFEPYGSKGPLGDSYTWKGGAIYGAKSGVGCMAFAFILSDEAFGSLPARPIKKGSFTFEDVKVGDILRVRGNSHSVIVLQKSAGGVIIAEANYNKSVHWGRVMSAAEVMDADFIITRYPQGYVPSDDAEEDRVVQNGTAGTLNWSLTNAGVLTISGKGAIPNYSSSNKAPWSEHEVYTVVIEKGVTGIGNYAFYQSKALSAYIPDGVTSIGQSAFCKSDLVAVTIPGTVKTIGDSAFRDCANLTSATVSEGVATIGDYAFRGCTALAYIDFPASITSVGAGAFMSCKEMVSVRFMPGSGTVKLGEGLFAQCQRLVRVTLPQTADCISKDMFQSCTLLPELYIPASVKEIGENPFTSCKGLKAIYFGGSEAEWNKMVLPALKASLMSTGTKVVFNAVFDDPFATEPDDPGDFLPGESEPCTNHVDADNDGYCDNCGETISTDNNDGEGETKPGDGDNNSSNGGSSGSSSNNSNGSSGSSGGSHRVSSLGGSGSSTVFSTTINRKSDGSSTMTKVLNDGTVMTMTNDVTGKTETEVKLSVLAIGTAEQYGKAVALPVSAVLPVRDAAMTPAITVYTERDGLVRVAIPTVSPTAGTVAVMVRADGSTEVINASAPTENSVVVPLPNGATVKIVDNSKSFLDVPDGAWFEEAAAFVSARELFYDTTETTFAPGEPMTYAVLMTALARFDGAETDGGTTWYEKSMEWAVLHGIGDGSNPDSHITGEQLVTILWKHLGSPAAVGTLPDNADGSQNSDAQKAMRWAMENGIVSGLEYGALDAQGQVNHAQAAQIIMNFVKTSTLNSAQ